MIITAIAAIRIENSFPFLNKSVVNYHRMEVIQDDCDEYIQYDVRLFCATNVHLLQNCYIRSCVVITHSFDVEIFLTNI